ncbi:MAG: pentapeptide repeat-containing protein [Oscillospiraceae bacterium]
MKKGRSAVKPEERKKIRQLEQDIKLMQKENKELFGDTPRKREGLSEKLRKFLRVNFSGLVYEPKDSADKTGMEYHDKFNNFLEIRSADFRSSDIDFQMLESGSYAQCNFTGLKFVNIQFNGYYYIDNDFSGADFIGCRFCSKTKCGGNDFSGAYFENTTFYKAELTGTDFTGAVFNNVKFFGCTLDRSTDFTGCEFKNVEIDGTRLGGSIFHSAETGGISIDRACADRINIGTADKPHIIYGKTAYEWLKERNNASDSCVK